MSEWEGTQEVLTKAWESLGQEMKQKKGKEK